MIPDRSHTVAFTGHRTYRGEADELLGHTLEALYLRGYRRFLSGMAVGFDLAAAEAVVELRQRHADAELVCIIPFSEHPNRFPAAELCRYNTLIGEADHLICLSEHYTPNCYYMRNDSLVDNSSYIVAYYDGSKSGGTYYTVRRAHRQHLPVENLYPDKQLKFEL